MIDRYDPTYREDGTCEMRKLHESERRPGEWVRYEDHVAETCKLRDKLLEVAKECSGCSGTGLVTIQYGGDGYGDKCCGLADADDQPCQECADIREVLE